METNIEEYFQFIPREILTEVILENFAESELIPLSLVCKSFWQLFDGAKLHFHLEEFSPLTIALVQFFEETEAKNKIEKHICEAAAMHGDIPLLKWTIDNNYCWTSGATRLAAKHDQLEVLKWALENKIKMDDKDIQFCATKKGHLRILKWNFEITRCLFTSIAVIAAEKGFLEVVKWLYGRIWGQYIEMLMAAAKYGHIEVFQWLILNGRYPNHSQWYRSLSKYLVAHKQLDILKWLYDQGYKLHDDIYTDSQDRGNLEMIEWLESIGYP